MSETSALLLKSRYTFLNTAHILRRQSLFKVCFIGAFAAGLLLGLWYLFLRGFIFLDSFEGASVIILGRLFSLFFFGMGAMIVVSSIVTAYSTIFRSEEVPFLMSRPFTVSQVVMYKFIESTALASWAFFFIIIPFVAAYAWHQELSPLFPVWTFLFSIPFILVCAGLGTICTQLCVRWLPRARMIALLVVLILIASCWAVWFFLLGPSPTANPKNFMLNRLIPGLRLASNPLLPSRWMAEGVMAFTRHDWSRGLMMLSVLTSNALMIGMLVEWIGRSTFFDAWQRTLTASGNRRRRAGVFYMVDRLLAFLPRDLRALITKDVRTFFRDPMQWSQALIFFGLLGLYFANLRSFHYHLLEPGWRNTIAFLNVFSVAAVMCSLGSRFVYPQLSLEGQGFWILGLSPTTMTRVLLSKFLLAVIGMLLVSLCLVTLSTRMLGLERSATQVALGIGCAMSFATAALSTGLGAIFLDIRQRNPAAIVSGFGGTLNLVLCLAFMLLSIMPFATIFHVFYRQQGVMPAAQLQQMLRFATVWLIVLTAITTIVPLAIGRYSLSRREY
jgi:ABC-2 type transport system permease protein